MVAIEIADNGPGIAKATNLFVPFFTTKKGGSGIGLALSRQIAELGIFAGAEILVGDVATADNRNLIIDRE